VGIFGNRAATLYKNTKGGAELVEVGGGNHPADGVEVLGGEADAGGVHLKAKEDTAGVTDGGFGGVQLPIFLNTQIQVIRPAGKEVLESVGPLRIVINVGGRAEVSLVGEGSDLGGDVGAGNGARIHFPEHHPGRFDEPKGGVDREELARGTRCESESVVH
jgi:hypothetical protein